MREPSRFDNQTNMDEETKPKFKSVRKMFGDDEVCYIMDAKNMGNIGRYLNVSVVWKCALVRANVIFFIAALVQSERFRPERVRRHARSSVPVGRVFRDELYPRRDGAYVEL